MSPLSNSAVGGQLAFDIEAMIHAAAVEASPTWTGAPLHFTSGYFAPTDLDAARAHWQFLHKANTLHVQSRMWHRAVTVPGGVIGVGTAGDHGFDLFTADLRCEPWKQPEPHIDCLCVGDLMYQAICEPCSWHVIAANENRAVEGWHDHAFPGWRELPIVPARLRDIEKTGLSKAAKKWIAEHFPPSMQLDGAPIITERSPMGTRHVPGRSPWGGYDISHTAVDPDRHVEPRKHRLTRDVTSSPLAPSTVRSTASPPLGLGD